MYFFTDKKHKSYQQIVFFLTNVSFLSCEINKKNYICVKINTINYKLQLFNLK
jgi:hypothetical protein